MTGHIASHRAMARAIENEADHLRVEAPGDHALICKTLRCMAAAHSEAANILERQELALLEKVGRIDRDFTPAPE